MKTFIELGGAKLKGLVFKLSIAAFIVAFCLSSSAFAARELDTFVKTSLGAIPAAGTIKFIGYYNTNGDDFILTEDSWDSATPNAGYRLQGPIHYARTNADIINSLDESVTDNVSSYEVWIQSTVSKEGNAVGLTPIPLTYPNYTNPGNNDANSLILGAAKYLNEPANPAGYAGHNRVIIKWDQVTGANEYRVYRWPTVHSGTLSRYYQKIATINSGTITMTEDASALDGTLYRYIIVATDGPNPTKMSPHTDEIVVTPSNTGLPTFTPAPTTANLNTSVVLTGSNFGSPGKVYFIDTNNNLVTADVTTAWGSPMTITVPLTAKVGANTIYVVNNSNMVGSAAFTVTSTVPTFMDILPANGNVGTTIVATVDGINTNFTASTTIEFTGGTGTVTGTFVSLQSATKATFSINITGVALTTARDVIVRTGSEMVTGAGAFTVTPLAPQFVSISPISGNQGQTLVATIDGANTHFDGTTTVEFTGGTGSVVGTFVSRQSATKATFNVNIGAGASAGLWNVIVRTPGVPPEQITGSGPTGFTVNSVVNTAPNSPNPASLAQYRSNGTTPIAIAGWTNEATVVLAMLMSDTNNPDFDTPEAEVILASGTFSGTPNYMGLGKPYSGSAVSGTVPVSGLAEGMYKWQALVQDVGGLRSAPTQFNGGGNAFGIDLTAPVASAPVPANGSNSTTAPATISVDITDALSGVDPATITAGNFTISGSVSGSHTTTPVLAGNTVTLTPITGALTIETVTVTVNNVADRAGNKLTYTWNFTVGGTPNPINPSTPSGVVMAYPNPFNPNDKANPLKMLFVGATVGEQMSLYIFDANGRVIYQRKDIKLPNSLQLTWDGQTAYGEVVENGLYLLRVVRESGDVDRGKVLVIKKK